MIIRTFEMSGVTPQVLLVGVEQLVERGHNEAPTAKGIPTTDPSFLLPRPQATNANAV